MTPVTAPPISSEPIWSPYRITAPIPPGLVVERYPDAVIITRPWRINAPIFKVLVIAYLGYAAYDTWIHRLALGPAVVIVLLISIFIVLLALNLVMGAINHTQISLSPSALRVRHAPIPWFDTYDLDTRSIKAVHTRYHLGGGRPRSRNQGACWVEVITNTGQQIELIHGWVPEDHARYLVHAIDCCLGLTDRALKLDPFNQPHPPPPA